MIPLISVIIIILILSAVCSLVEAALFTVPIHRVQVWVEQRIKHAIHLLKIKELIQEAITSIVILNNISNIVGSIVVGSLIADEFEDNKLVIGVVSGIFTFLIIVFSEIIPKIIGERYADKISLISARPILFITRLFKPFLQLILFMTKPFKKGKSFPLISEEEIRIYASLGTKEGILDKEEEAIIQRALLLNDITVREIMTPRIKMFILEENTLLKNAQNDVLKSKYSRIPLYKDSSDQITGLLYKNDALSALIKGKDEFPLFKLRKKVLFIPENKPIGQLMEELRKTQSHTAIVIDEYGGTAGLATLEDILEELVGDIIGEDDLIDDKYVICSDNEILAPGHTLVEEVNDFFDTRIENHRTISKLILDELNRFPTLNETMEWDGLLFTIEELTSKTIEKVRIQRKFTVDHNYVDKNINQTPV